MIPANHQIHILQPASDAVNRANISLDTAEHYHAPATNYHSQLSPNSLQLPSIRHTTNGASGHAPPPVDFTNYRQPSPSNTLPPLNFPLPEPGVLGRKRSHDEATSSPESMNTSANDRGHHRPRLPPIADTEPRRSLAPPIDPSLDGSEENNRKAALEAQRENLRAQLAMIEAQLARAET